MLAALLEKMAKQNIVNSQPNSLHRKTLLKMIGIIFLCFTLQI